jgi:hypothetical protein
MYCFVVPGNKDFRPWNLAYKAVRADPALQSTVFSVIVFPSNVTTVTALNKFTVTSSSISGKLRDMQRRPSRISDGGLIKSKSTSLAVRGDHKGAVGGCGIHQIGRLRIAAVDAIDGLGVAVTGAWEHTE